MLVLFLATLFAASTDMASDCPVTADQNSVSYHNPAVLIRLTLCWLSYAACIDINVPTHVACLLHVGGVDFTVHLWPVRSCMLQVTL